MRLLIMFSLISSIAICNGANRFILNNVNTINVINKSSRSITAGFFKNLGPYQPSFNPERTIELSPGNSESVELANGWEGRVQKLSGAAADPATWAEIKFDSSFQDMTYCDISLIRGYNGAMLFTTPDASLSAGFTQDVYQDAPDQCKTKDKGGFDVLQPTQPYSGGTNEELVKYYRGKLPSGSAFILPDDYSSVRGIVKS